MVKIFGLEINRSLKNAEATGGVSLVQNLQKTEPSVPLTRAFPRQELGDSGTRILHGIIGEEYLSNLQGIQGITVFDEMRKSDATVRAAIAAVTLPVIRAKWFVNPATVEQKDKDVANLIEHALFDWLDIAWQDFVRQALLMVPFGVMLFEKVYTTKDHEGKTWVVLEKLAPRLPKSILRWELNDRTFGIQQIRQDGVLAQIPGSKLAIFVNDREGDNWWGNSLIRPAYKHWYYKNSFYKIDALAFERQGLGVPKITMPEGYTESDEKKATQAAQNLRANESAYLLLPPKYEAEFMDMGAKGTRDPTNSIAHHDKAILQSVLAQFLELGQGKSNSGSRALSQDHSDLFLKSVEVIANTILSVINKDIIPELVDLNFNDIVVYPVLDYSGITKADVAALGTAYSQLVTAGALTPTPDDEQYLRAAMGLPPRTQDDIDAETDDDPSEEDLLDNADIEDDDPAGPEEEANEEDAVNKATKNAKPDAKTKTNNKKVDKAAQNKKPLPKKASEHYHRLKRSFADGNGFTSWRPLTFAEGKVTFKDLQDTMNEMEANFSKQATDMLNEAKDSFMTKLHALVNAGDTKGIADLEFKFVNDYKALLKDAMKKAYEYGKVNVSAEMGIAAPANVADSVANIDLMADTIANKTASDLATKAKVATANALKTNTTTLQSLGVIDAALEQAIDKTVSTTAGLLVGQGVNDGRNDVFDRNSGMIQSLQRSEILDDVTCNFCLSMDGLVIEPDDDWADTSIFHGNCRGIWVAILTDEENPPDITGIPNKIGDYFGGQPNELVQPPKPIVQPGSLAEKAIADKEAKK